MIESFVFHRLITDFEEKALRVDNFEEDAEHVHARMKPGVQVPLSPYSIARKHFTVRGSTFLWKCTTKMFSLYGIWLKDWCNSQQTKTCYFQSAFFLTDSPICFSPPLILPGKASASPLRLCFVNFWLSLARMRLLIFFPKRELSSLVPSVVAFCSYFLATNSTRYSRCSALGDAKIFHTHIWVVKFLQFLWCN